MPFLILEAVFSNIGGTATLVGDPPNVIIGSMAHIPFNDFIIQSITSDGWDENDFLINAWGLPVVGVAKFRIAKQGGLWKLFGFARPGAVLTYQSSADLENWGPFRNHVDVPGSSTFGIDISDDLQFNPAVCSTA